jgi:recombinational DNA repair protein RecR
MTDREIAHEIIGKLLDADVEAFERTITDAENTVYHVLQQVKKFDLADAVLSEERTESTNHCSRCKDECEDSICPYCEMELRE